MGGWACRRLGTTKACERVWRFWQELLPRGLGALVFCFNCLSDFGELRGAFPGPVAWAGVPEHTSARADLEGRAWRTKQLCTIVYLLSGLKRATCAGEQVESRSGSGPAGVSRALCVPTSMDDQGSGLALPARAVQASRGGQGSE